MSGMNPPAEVGRSGEGTKSLKAWHEARRRKSGESTSGLRR
jgi:hypothetical protein